MHNNGRLMTIFEHETTPALLFIYLFEASLRWKRRSPMYFQAQERKKLRCLCIIRLCINSLLQTARQRCVHTLVRWNPPGEEKRDTNVSLLNPVLFWPGDSGAAVILEAATEGWKTRQITWRERGGGGGKRGETFTPG